jgi:tetratricopeptide (TPR) repeat protein
VPTVAALLLTVLLASPPEPPDTALARGEKLLEARKYAAAEAALRKAVEEDPSSARVHGDLALALLAQARTREAVNEARLSAALGPALSEARLIYGLTLSADGRPVDAARELEKADTLKPGQAGILRALAAAYAAAEDDRTVATYEKAIALRPGEPALRGELAEYLWRVGRSAEGNEVLEEALRVFPDDIALTLRYGRSLAEQDRYLDATAVLEKTRSLGSRDASTYSLLAAAYGGSGKTDEAIGVLEAAVETFPADSPMRHDLGRLRLSQGDAPRALPSLEEAARLDPRSAPIQVDLGRAEEMLGRLEEAGAAYRRATKLSPNLPGAHYALGRLLLKQGRRGEAEKELAIHRSLYELGRARVAQADASAGEAAFAWAELNQGRAAEALARFEALGDTAEAMRGRAIALSRLDRHREAVEALERARQIAPEDPRIELLLVAERSRVEEKR